MKYLSLLILLWVAGKAHAQTIRYVLPDGFGSGSACSDRTPCRFLTAWNASNPGDVINMKTHASWSTWSFPVLSRNGTALNPIVIQTKPGDANVTVRSASNGIDAQYLTFKNLVFDGALAGEYGDCHRLAIGELAL